VAEKDTSVETYQVYALKKKGNSLTSTRNGAGKEGRKKEMIKKEIR
jgi:hypothetical protein